MIVRNKWNGNDYIVVEINGNNVTLQSRTDGRRFTIQKSEYFFNYFEKSVDKLK